MSQKVPKRPSEAPVVVKQRARAKYLHESSPRNSRATHRIAPEIPEFDNAQSPPDWIGRLPFVWDHASERSDEARLGLQKLCIELFYAAESNIAVDDIKAEVAGYYSLQPEDLDTRPSSRSLTRFQETAIFLAAKWTALPPLFIGAKFGIADAGAVISGAGRIRALLASGKLSDDISQIEKRIIENTSRLSYNDDNELLFTIRPSLEVARVELLDGIDWVRRRLIEQKPADGDEGRRLIDPRLILLDRFAKDHPGAPISTYVLAIFPELAGEQSSPSRRVEALPEPATSANSRPELSRVVPASWEDREPGDTPVSFVRKNYGAWRDGVWDRNGLTKPDLRKRDPALYQALATWERRHPEDRLALPTKMEVNDLWVERVRRGEEVPETARDIDRFHAASARRGGLARKGPGD